MAPLPPGSMVDRVVDHARREWPREACGFLFVTARGWVHAPARNAQDDLHRRDPMAHPKTAEYAYVVSPPDMVGLLEKLKSGDRLAAIYHSHPRAWGANFSDTDVRAALVGHQPQFPEALQLVVSLRPDGLWIAKGYRWDPSGRRFRLAFERGPEARWLG